MSGVLGLGNEIGLAGGGRLPVGLSSSWPEGGAAGEGGGAVRCLLGGGCNVGAGRTLVGVFAGVGGGSSSGSGDGGTDVDADEDADAEAKARFLFLLMITSLSSWTTWRGGLCPFCSGTTTVLLLLLLVLLFFAR